MQNKKSLIRKMRKLDLDFNDLFILGCFYDNKQGDFFKMFKIPSIKDFSITSRFQKLKKEEYIVSDPSNADKYIISKKGSETYDRLESEDTDEILDEVSAKIEVSTDNQFEEWWKTYPTTPAWTSDDKRTKFIGSRALKNITKAKAKKEYLSVLNQGIKHEEMLEALKYEIQLKKLDSIKKNENQLEYFKGMESYLNQKRYLLFVEMLREENVIHLSENIKSKKFNVTDI